LYRSGHVSLPGVPLAPVFHILFIAKDKGAAMRQQHHRALGDRVAFRLVDIHKQINRLVEKITGRRGVFNGGFFDAGEYIIPVPRTIAAGVLRGQARAYSKAKEQ
jgi:hypothetical protein